MYAGPVWDFDTAFGVWEKFKANTEYKNFYAAEKYLANGLIKIESFRNAVKAALDKNNGYFYKAAVGLTGTDGAIERYAREIQSSQLMNYKLRQEQTCVAPVAASKEATFNNAVNFMKDYALNRLNRLSAETSKWNGSNYTLTVESTANLTPLQKLIKAINDLFKRIREFFASLIK